MRKSHRRGVPGRGSSMNKRNLICLLLYPVLGHGGGEVVWEPLHTRCLTQQGLFEDRVSLCDYFTLDADFFFLYF